MNDLSAAQFVTINVDWTVTSNDTRVVQGDQILISSFRDTGSARPEGPQPETWSGVLGEGQPVVSPPAMGDGGVL